MKFLICIFAATSLSALASTIDSHTFPVFGIIEGEEKFLLTTTQTRTTYRQETVAQTCFRTELAGYQNACDYYPEVRCYETRDSARVCTSVPVYRCQQLPQYREVPYTCYRTINTPYEVADHQVMANFNVKITSKPKEPTNPTACLVGFRMEGDLLKSNADCNEFLILSNEKKTTEFDRSGTIVHNYNVALSLLDSQTTLAPLLGGIAEMHMEGHFLVFRSGDLSQNPNFNLKLFVERRHLLKGDETLINRNLLTSEYSFQKMNERFGIVKIDLDKLLGGINDKKKHVIKVHLNLNLESGLLLNNQKPDLVREGELTINN